jgi:ADP-ribosylation factor-binding protein GGA
MIPRSSKIMLMVLSSKSPRFFSTRDQRFRNGSQMQNQMIPSHLVLMISHCMSISDISPSDTYLQTNDQLNGVLERYEAFKRGETPPASIPSEFLPGKNDSTSLIEFDDSPPLAGSSSGAGSGSTTADDLAGLFSSSVSLTSTSATSPVGAFSGGLGESPLLTSILNQPTPAISPQFASPLHGSVAPSSRPSSHFGQIKLPSTPPLQNQLQASGRVGPSPLGATKASPSTNPATTSTLQQPLVAQASSTPPSQMSTPQGKDPFADLVGLF